MNPRLKRSHDARKLLGRSREDTLHPPARKGIRLRQAGYTSD
jgi:hypothetical protein